MLTSPMNMRVFSNLQEQFQFAREERIVIGKLEAKQRKGFHKRSAPHNHFGASVGEKVYGCELLKYAHGVIRAQNGNGTGEADPFGPNCRRSQDRFRRRIKKLRPVMLADPKNVQPDTIRRLDFLEKMTQAISRAEVLTRERVWHRSYKAINTDLHLLMLPQFCKRSLWTLLGRAQGFARMGEATTPPATLSDRNRFQVSVHNWAIAGQSPAQGSLSKKR